MMIWSPVSDFPATVGQGLPQGQSSIIGHEAVIGFGHLWLLCDSRGVLIDVGFADSVNAAQDKILVRAIAFSEQERKPGRPPSTLRGANNSHRNYRRNARIAALHKANQIGQERIERLYLDNQFETVGAIRDQLQIILCDMSIIALADSVRRCSKSFEQYFELPDSVVGKISDSIKQYADQIDSIASDLLTDRRETHEMLSDHFQLVLQRLEEIIARLRREGFLIDRDLFRLTQRYCVMHKVPEAQKMSPSTLSTDWVPMDDLVSVSKEMKHFLQESQELQDELVSRLMAAQFQCEKWIMGSEEEDEADLKFDELMRSSRLSDDAL